MIERREHSRERAFQAGSIAISGQDGGIPCVIRDLSEAGALLLVDEPRRAPSRFTLTLARGGEARPARVVWRGDAGVGVAFAPGRDAVDESSPAASAEVVSLDAVRRGRSGDRRLAERIAMVLRPRPRPQI